MNQYLLLASLFLYLTYSSYGQRCATELPEEHSIGFEKWMKNKLTQPRILSGKEDKVYRIPIVVHVIHQGEKIGEGTNISDEQIRSQIKVLNEDFNRINSDTINTPDIFKEVASNPGIKFELAYQDPNGNDTSGITRTFSDVPSWNPENGNDREVLKSIIVWPPEDYLNIWVVDLLGTFLGHAQFPDSANLPGLIPPYDAETDGVIIDYKTFGSVNKIDSLNLWSNYDLGRSTTHEVGHFLGLLHLWGNGGCGSDDYCEDTPNQDSWNYSCPNLDSISCGSRDMYENYMDYTYDACMNLFTKDQVARMHVVLDNSPRRNSLLTSHALTPIDGNDKIVGLEDEIHKEILIYPNPARYGRLIIKTEILGNYEVSIMDVNGKVLQSISGDNYIELDLKEIRSGIYFVKVVGNDRTKVSRIFVSK